MENLKIRVNSEEQSKEAQELFFELGFQWKYNNLGKKTFYCKEDVFLYAIDGVLGTGIIGQLDFFNKHQAKEITIPELRDMVVLKRNHVGDATHKGSITDNVYYVSSDEEVYRFESSTWCFSTVIVADLKPIDKPMKEYLNKLTDGTYKLVVLDSVADGVEGLIEVPEGAEFLTECFDDGELFRLWWKEEYKICIGYDEDWFNIHRDVGDYLEEQSGSKVVWQRHTHPEELPFVDDEPSLNDRYTEIEQVRKEYKLKNDMSVDDCRNSLRCADAVNHPSHYASSSIECIDAMEAMLTPEQFIGYLRGNAFKYQWRYENKGGITDLEKAQWYLNKLISLVG